MGILQLPSLLTVKIPWTNSLMSQSYLLICKLSLPTVHYLICFFKGLFLKALKTWAYRVFAVEDENQIG